MRSSCFQLAAVLLALGQLTAAVHTVVDLGYSEYRGRVVGVGTTQWLGMRFAAPPVGRLRFAAPVDPPKTNGVQDATKFGNICLAQDPTDWSMKPNPRFTAGEDCLYVNVFAPSNASTASKLPVMFFIQGGGFGSNSNANYNASDLAREGNMVVVSINYRVGPYGFLQSREVVEGGSLNSGIRDQIKALEWTKEHVGKFGGDPDHVVLVGDSAGAISIVILLTSPKMRDANLFVGAISESVSVPRLRTLDMGQEQYNCLLQATGCSATNSTSSLACLRSVNATALETTTCLFSPHFDNDLIPQPILQAFDKGEYLKIPTIFGSTRDEGTKQVPQATDSVAVYHYILLSACPSLTSHALTVLDDMYITNKSAPVFPESGRLWRQVSDAVGDVAFHCIDKFFSDAIARDGGKTWSYRYAVDDAALEAQGFGAYHTIELYAVWGPNNTDGNPPKSYLPGQLNEGIVPVVRGYWTSFVKYLDPNVGRAPGTPVWAARDEGEQRIRFASNATRMEVVDQKEGRRCEVLEPLMRCLEMKGNVTELEAE